jgi:archaellum component FlaC
MDETFGARLRKTAEEVAQRFNEAAQQAGERIGEMRETQRLTQQIRTLTQERDKLRFAMADLVMRMFDQNAFMQELLRPDYQRVKEIDEEIHRLEKEREVVGQEPAEKTPPTASDEQYSDVQPCDE